MAAYKPIGPSRNRYVRGRRRFFPKPPAGTYDPVLDQQYAAARRGLGDLRLDTEQANERASDDVALARNRTTQQANFSLRDLARSQGRGTEDYWHQRADLQRGFQQLASNQLQQGNAAGLLGGGYLQQAARKRAANEVLARGDLNTANVRRLQDLDRAKYRVGVARDQRLGDINLSYQRGTEDRTRSLSRAQREFREYGVDVGESRFYEAKSTGWVPPAQRRRRRGARPLSRMFNRYGRR